MRVLRNRLHDGGEGDVAEGFNDVIGLDNIRVAAVAIMSNCMTEMQGDKVAQWAKQLARGKVTLRHSVDEKDVVSYFGCVAFSIVSLKVGVMSVRVAEFVILRIGAAALVVLVFASSAVPDEPPQSNEAARSKRLDLMRERAAAATVIVKCDVEPFEAELVKAPILRYDDQPRRCVDAALWLWTVDKRPVAVCKVEVARPDDGAPRWVTCLSSLSGSLIDVDWSSGHRWASRASIDHQPIPNGPDPSDSQRLRLTQMKSLARRFSAVLVIDSDRQVLRLLPNPIYRYEAPDAGVMDAALFALTANGTNPDAILVVQLHKADAGDSTWRYAIAPVTADAIELQLDNTTVWKKSPTGLTGSDTHYYFYERRPLE